MSLIVDHHTVLITTANLKLQPNKISRHNINDLKMQLSLLPILATILAASACTVDICTFDVELTPFPFPRPSLARAYLDHITDKDNQKQVPTEAAARRCRSPRGRRRHCLARTCTTCVTSRSPPGSSSSRGTTNCE